ncbi:serine--tRNA ligase [Lactiplantibacillus plantarum]|nr:serine--tRNA ligase [Lactiplantibacillus plantarum]
MLNPKFVRNNPELVKTKLQTRKVDPAEVDEYLQLDQQNRDAITKVEGLKKQKNQLTEQIGQSDPQSEAGQALIQQVKQLNGDIKSTEAAQTEVNDRLHYLAIRFPNLPADDVPVGPDEDSNVEMRKHGDIPTFDFKPKAHWELGESLGILDFDRAAKVAGARFVYYKDAGALLERAVYSFMLDLHTQKQGYHEIIPPYLVNAQTMYGTGQFPKFKEDVYTVESSGMTLIPTAEVPLTNYYANEILSEDQLPTYFTAMTPCYRS